MNEFLYKDALIKSLTAFEENLLEEYEKCENDAERASLMMHILQTEKIKQRARLLSGIKIEVERRDER